MRYVTLVETAPQTSGYDYTQLCISYMYKHLLYMYVYTIIASYMSVNSDVVRLARLSGYRIPIMSESSYSVTQCVSDSYAYKSFDTA